MNDTNLQNIAVVGVGGVGGYFGSKLCCLQQGGHHVTFIARGEHLRAIQQSGLRVTTDGHADTICRPSLVTDDFGQLSPLDLCLVCVKEFDLSNVLANLLPVVTERTTILPLLNGVDIYSRVRSQIRRGVVLPACVYVGTHIQQPGTVYQKGGACKILCGPDPQQPDYIPHELLALLKRADVRAEWTPDIQVEIWKKFIFICAFGLATSAYDKTLGEILQDQTLLAETRAIMEEIKSVARACKIVLPDDIADESLRKARDFPFEAKTSFQRDFERTDKHDERDLFVGSTMRMAQQYGVDVPRVSAIAEILCRRKAIS